MTKNTNANSGEMIDLMELIYALWNKWYIILISGIVCALIGLTYTKVKIPETYQSKTSIYIYNQQSDRISYNDLQTGYILTKDYEVLVKSRTVLEAVIEKLDLNMSYQQLRGMIGVSTPDSTRIVEITVVTTDPQLSKDIADTVRVISSKNIAEVMGIDAVNVVDEANLPTGKSGPNIGKNTIMAGLAGGLAACAVIIVLHFLNDTICTQDDVEAYLGLSTLGIIPLDESLSGRNKKTQKSGKKRLTAKRTNM